MTRLRIAVSLLSAMAAWAPAQAWAQTPDQAPQPPPPSVQPAQPLPDMPWRQDRAMLQAAQPDLQKGGIRALGPHVPAYEAALANGKQYFPDGVVVEGKRYVPADGLTESLLVLTAAAAAAKTAAGGGMPVVTLANPYPVIALQLGTYYDEMGEPAEGVRVLDAGLALSPKVDEKSGAHVGEMIGEKGFALGALKRYAEALAVYDEGLAIASVNVTDRARLDRGRGFILTETDRLDEAEAAYRASLAIEPGNPRAQRELDYIAHLKAGGAKAAVETTLVPHDPPRPPPLPTQTPQQ